MKKAGSVFKYILLFLVFLGIGIAIGVFGCKKYFESRRTVPPIETPVQEKEVVITNTIPANADGYRTIIYFTVEFSNDVSTFYKYDSENDYYVHYTSGSTVGFNSNCYIGASLTSLEFTIG